jgi:hypothetical protein
VINLGQWDAVDTTRPPLEMMALALLPPGTDVAVTVDGVVAAVAPVQESPFGGAVNALLWPGALHDGANEIGLHVVDGDADAPVLHALPVVAAQ